MDSYSDFNTQQDAGFTEMPFSEVPFSEVPLHCILIIRKT